MRLEVARWFLAFAFGVVAGFALQISFDRATKPTACYIDEVIPVRIPSVFDGLVGNGEADR